MSTKAMVRSRRTPGSMGYIMHPDVTEWRKKGAVPGNFPDHRPEEKFKNFNEKSVPSRFMSLGVASNDKNETVSYGTPTQVPSTRLDFTRSGSHGVGSHQVTLDLTGDDMGYLDMKLDEERRREEGLLRDLDVVGTLVTGEEAAFQSAASVYEGVGVIQERESNQMVSVLGQAKDPDLTPAENAARMTALMGQIACWDGEVNRRIDAKHAEEDRRSAPSAQQRMRDVRQRNRQVTSDRLLASKKSSVAKTAAKNKTRVHADPNPMLAYSKGRLNHI
mmetsp:Transcript_1733/g.2090  ORF Transcript_1733/g.2090 Transcript_1733/m.2090 type:complete len:276 (-) Transcript_1733:1044-1871(-)